MLKEDVEQIIKKINKLIEENNKLVKQGQNSLESKYFFITKDISHYVESIIEHNEKEFINKIKLKPKINIIDVFAGSGMFTLIFSKCLLELVLIKKVKIESFDIVLNDKMYKNTDIINWKDLEKKFKSIYQNLNKEEFIKIEKYDMTFYSDELNEYIKDESFNIITANPMYLAISKGKEHFEPISFLNEDLFLKNGGIKNLVQNLISKSDYFIYLTKQLTSNLLIDSHKNKTSYINDYFELTITETEKKRYEIFNYKDIDKMKQENFWLFTNSQKENFNSIVVYKKGKDIEHTYRYVYNKIYDTKNQRLLKSKINQIKEKLHKITLAEVVEKYNELKAKL